MVLMYFVMFFLFSVSSLVGVLVIGNSLCVVLFMFMLVVCVESSIVISNLNGVVYFSLVVGVGLFLCRVLKMVWCLVEFIVGVGFSGCWCWVWCCV